MTLHLQFTNSYVQVGTACTVFNPGCMDCPRFPLSLTTNPRCNNHPTLINACILSLSEALTPHCLLDIVTNYLFIPGILSPTLCSNTTVLLSIGFVQAWPQMAANLLMPSPRSIRSQCSDVIWFTLSNSMLMVVSVCITRTCTAQRCGGLHLRLCMRQSATGGVV